MHRALTNLFARLRKDEKGVTLVEYGIALVLAVTVGTGALLTLSGTIDTDFGLANGAATYP